MRQRTHRAITSAEALDVTVEQSFVQAAVDVGVLREAATRQVESTGNLKASLDALVKACADAKIENQQAVRAKTSGYDDASAANVAKTGAQADLDAPNALVRTPQTSRPRSKRPRAPGISASCLRSPRPDTTSDAIETPGNNRCGRRYLPWRTGVQRRKTAHATDPNKNRNCICA